MPSLREWSTRCRHRDVLVAPFARCLQAERRRYFHLPQVRAQLRSDFTTKAAVERYWAAAANKNRKTDQQQVERQFHASGVPEPADRHMHVERGAQRCPCAGLLHPQPRQLINQRRIGLAAIRRDEAKPAEDRAGPLNVPPPL